MIIGRNRNLSLANIGFPGAEHKNGVIHVDVVVIGRDIATSKTDIPAPTTGNSMRFFVNPCRFLGGAEASYPIEPTLA
jgi:hypothetical protein